MVKSTRPRVNIHFKILFGVQFRILNVLRNVFCVPDCADMNGPTIDWEGNSAGENDCRLGLGVAVPERGLGVAEPGYVWENF